MSIRSGQSFTIRRWCGNWSQRVAVLSLIRRRCRPAARLSSVPTASLQRLNRKSGSEGLDCVDATCPFVAKIHRIVREESRKGRIILIAGDENHPEVRGICGHCIPAAAGGRVWYAFKSLEELTCLLKRRPFLSKTAVSVVAQTTFNGAEWKKCLQNIKKVCTNALTFDTICNATALRQTEAVGLAKRSDLMVVIGGHHSSNTAKLREVCAEYCETCLVETADELPLEALRAAHFVGVTAGASTPADIIKEVLVTMSEIIEDAVQNSAEAGDPNFEEMLEESLKSLNTDERVHGVVVGISPTEVYVDVGRKQAGFIPVAELSNDPSVKPEDVVKIGDEMDLLIMRTNDQEGTIMLSKKRLDAIQGWENIAASGRKQGSTDRCGDGYHQRRPDRGYTGDPGICAGIPSDSVPERPTGRPVAEGSKAPHH